MNKRQEFLNNLRIRIANLAIGPSTLRNQGAPKVIEIARQFLAQVNLREFAVRNEIQFLRCLEQQTRALQKEFPRDAQNWGAARKALNIFLRDVLYNSALCSRYRLQPLLPWLEVPLDKEVAKSLLKTRRPSELRWVGVKNLSPDISRNFQELATELANKWKVHRVDLDVFFWRSAQFARAHRE